MTYNFRVKWDGAYVAAVTHVSGLDRKTAVVSFRAGGQPQGAIKIPGQSDNPPVRLERGIITDTAFEQWAQMLALDMSRKEIQIELYNQAGVIVERYNLHNCWPSEYTALPDLDSEANTVSLAGMTLEHEGWDRDTTVTPPTAGTG